MSNLPPEQMTAKAIDYTALLAENAELRAALEAAERERDDWRQTTTAKEREAVALIVALDARRDGITALPDWLRENGMDPQSVGFVEANINRLLNPTERTET